MQLDYKRCHNATAQTTITVGVDTTSNKDNNSKDTDTDITHSDLYQLLTTVMPMSDDRSISRSTTIKAILNHVFSVINKHHDDIQQAISQYYSPVSTTGSSE